MRSDEERAAALHMRSDEERAAALHMRSDERRTSVPRMRSDSERIAELHRRAARLEQKKRERRVMIAQAAGTAAGLAAVILLALFMPGTAGRINTETTTGFMSASIFSGSSVTGFIIIGVTAFLLGVSVTVFCFRLKKYYDEPDTGIARTEKTDTAIPGTTNPGTTNPGTTNPGTTNPGTTNLDTTIPGTSDKR